MYVKLSHPSLNLCVCEYESGEKGRVGGGKIVTSVSLIP